MGLSFISAGEVVGFGQPELDVPRGVGDSGRPGLALVVLSVVEQRLDRRRRHVRVGHDVRPGGDRRRPAGPVHWKRPRPTPLQP